MRDEVIETMARGLHARSFSILGSMCDEWEDFKPDAIAAIRALEASGFKIVGREATEGMVDAILDGTPDSFHFTAAQPLWASMFDAAPTYGETGE